MRQCKDTQKNLVAFLYKELDKEEQNAIRSHCDSCPGCRQELEMLRRTLQQADFWGEDIEKAMNNVDWQSLPSQIADRVLATERLPQKKSSLGRLFLFQPKWRPVYAGLVLGLLIGSLGMWIVLKRPHALRPNGDRFFASQDFIERVDLEMARRQTLDYLEKSQFLLLDFVQPSSGEGQVQPAGFDRERARELLSKKKLLNEQLNKFKMAKAKEICDQIELLFLELSQITEGLSAEQVQEIQKMVEEKRLLLKINLLKKELEQSEV